MSWRGCKETEQSSSGSMKIEGVSIFSKTLDTTGESRIIL
jgi:hypothetical protein